MQGRATRSAERTFKTITTWARWRAGGVLGCTELDMVIDVDANAADL
jgi:aspartate racemase